MCAQSTAEWPGFFTWTKFQAEPGVIDEIIFDPLYTWSSSISMPGYGRIIGSPQDCILSLSWHPPEAYDEFKASPEHQQLMANLKVDLAKAHAQVMVFENRGFGSGANPIITEILTAYWSALLSPETQDAVWDLETLVHTLASGIRDRRCYTQPAVFGWITEPQPWNDDKALASVWIDTWKNQELEDRFKRNEKRVVSMGRDVIYPLAVDNFEKRLPDLGVVGWESVHVCFEDVNWIYDDEIKRYFCLERRRLDELARGTGAV